MNRIQCPKCKKEIVYKETNNEGVVFCNYCGSKMRVVIQLISDNNQSSSIPSIDDDDELLPLAIKTVREYGSASVSVLQRRLNLGYPRAARLIDLMEKKGIIGPFEGSSPRKIL